MTEQEYEKAYNDSQTAFRNGEFQKGLSIMLAFASSGNTRAQFVVAEAYRIGGPDLEKNEETAEEWYKIAEASGHEFAAYYLCGVQIRSGKIEEGIKSIKRASELGFHKASALLGKWHLKGSYVQFDAVKAMQYFQLAKEQGSPIADIGYNGAIWRGADGLLKRPVGLVRMLICGIRAGRSGIDIDEFKF